MFAAFINTFKIPELRKRIIFTFLLLAVCRLAANVPVPNIDPEALASLFDSLSKNSATSGAMGIFNMFSGGALQKFAVAALGIMPYITASIIIQLMTPVFPFLEKLSREGEAGRGTLTQYTRYLTVIICFVQGFMLAKSMENPSMIGLPNIQVVINPGWAFRISTIIILLAGTMILMWLGEQITEKGIGNGASLIITVNIVNKMPAAISNMIQLVYAGSVPGSSQSFTPIHILLLCAFFFLMCALTVALTQGIRKIPVRYAARMSGNKSTKGQVTYMPLRVNHSGVMPLIFASAILMFPPFILRIPFLRPYAGYWTYGGALYITFYAVMILLFSFFWVANQFNPIQIADDLKRNGAYVPGVRPGKPTADFIDFSMTRITVAGSLFLLLLAIIPMMLAQKFGIPNLIARFFGGTSLLIIVGVMLDTLRQVETNLLARRYDGFLDKGKIRSRRRG